jgi:hypothetical protein
MWVSCQYTYSIRVCMACSTCHPLLIHFLVKPLLLCNVNPGYFPSDATDCGGGYCNEAWSFQDPCAATTAPTPGFCPHALQLVSTVGGRHLLPLSRDQADAVISGLQYEVWAYLTMGNQWCVTGPPPPPAPLSVEAPAAPEPMLVEAKAKVRGLS